MANQSSIPRPRVACEISADRLVAARAGEKGSNLEAATTAALPPGMLTPGLQQANISDRAKLLPALRDSLAAVAARSRDICLIIPDASTRIMLLDFETLPDKAVDADAVVRFRLKKSLPFDVDQCSVSFDRQTTVNPVRVVAAITPRSVLEEYESLVLEAGYNPGAVVPSMIAALGLVDASRPTMVIKVERGTTTFAIVDQDQLLLYRALDNGGEVVSGESLVDDVNTSLVYFEDRYGVGVDRMLVTGVHSAQGLENSLSTTSQMRVEDLVSSTSMGAAAGNINRSALAGVMGALVA
jgi:type IV pilus assembly protein PilM